MQFLLEMLLIVGFSNDLVINCKSRAGERQMTLSCLLLQYLQNTTSFSLKLPFARESPSACILHLNAFGLCGCSNCRGLLKQQSHTGAYTEPYRTHKTHIQSSQGAAGLQAFVQVHLCCAELDGSPWVPASTSFSLHPLHQLCS